MAEQTSRLAIVLDSSKAQRSTDTLATSLERLTVQGEKATDSTDGLSFSFKRLATTAAGAMSISMVIGAVDNYGQMAARMKNALKSVTGDIKDFSDIQERFLAISNRNGKAIETTQELYIGTATAMKELGYNTSQTVDYIESMSSAFTANATSAMATESALNALQKANIEGKVSGQNWNAIMNATPTILGDIAKELERTNGGMKVTETQVKKLASEGKISFKLFADAVMKAKDANNELADSMDNTKDDGLTRVANSAKVYYGEMNQALGITRAISAGLADISNNFDTVATGLTAVVGIGAARYFGNLSSSLYDTTKKSVAAALTNQRLATEQVNVTKATIAQIKADKAAALAAIESTKAQQAAATTEVQRISLKTQLANQTASLTALTHAEALATDELTAAKARLTSASSLAKSALGLIGGPTGAAMLAGGAIYYFYQKSQQAREEALAFADSIKGLRDSFDDMTVTALKGSISKAYDSIVEQQKEIGVLKADLMGLRDAYKLVGNDGDKLAEVQRKIDKKTQELEVKTKALEATMKFAADAQSLLNSKLNSAEEAFQSAAQNTRSYANALGAAIGFMNAVAAAKRNLDTEMMTTPTPEEAYGGKDAAQYIKDMQKRAEIAKMADRERTVEQARYNAERQGYIDPVIEQAGILAGIEFDEQQKRQQALKDSKAAATYSESAAQKRLSSLQEQNAALKFQSEVSDKLGAQQQALVKWNQEIKGIEDKQAKGKLTADQKSLLANKALITSELERAAEYEKIIQRKEAEVKIAAYNKQLMEETAQAQRAYDMELKGAGMGNLARGRLQEELRLNEEYLKKQEALTAQFNDKSTGITQEMYDRETQVIKNELDKRLVMMRVHQAEIDGLRANWGNGIDEGLRNYVDNARNYSQQAEDFITNSLQNITSGSADALTDMVTNSKNAFDAIGDFFGDLSKSIIKDLIRIAIQAQITNAITGLFGGMAGGSGAAAGAGASASGTGAMGMSTSWRAYSSGGYTGSGNKYDPRGIVHAGEFVFTKEATDKIGKENLYHLMNTGKVPMDALKTDEYAKRALHPAYQTNNTTNNSNVNNNSETNESAQSSVVIYQTVNQTITVTGNGDKTLEKVVQIAIDKGSKKAIAEIQRDFATNGTTRKILER